METEYAPDIKICHTVTIRQQKCVVFDVFFNSFNTRPCHGIKSGVGESNFPSGLRMTGNDLDILAAQLNREIIGEHFIVVEVILDDFALIAKAQDKVLEPVLAVGLHDVPEYRHSAD